MSNPESKSMIQFASEGSILVHANLDHVASSIVGLIMRYITFNKNFEPHSSKYIILKFATHNLIFLIKKFSHVNINIICYALFM
jgi:hypothetical protein